MPSTFWFDKSRVLAAVRAGVKEGLDEVANVVAADAKRRAPIRKVFKERRGFRPRTRSLTRAELSQAISRANAYYGVNKGYLVGRKSPRHPLTFYEASVRLARPGSANSLARSRKLRTLGYERGGRFISTSGARRNRTGGFEPGPALGKALTSRGRYEVRSGRAIHLEASAHGTQNRVQVGGALKASIGNEGVTETSTGMKATVAASIRYAKFVEFPTIRTRAQPFLLPALHQQRRQLPQTVAAAIKRNLGG